MRNVRRSIICVFLTMLMFLSPSFLGGSRSEAVITEAISSVAQGTETAMILAECIEILTNLEIHTDKIEGAQKFVQGLNEAYYAVQSLNEIKGLAQSVIDFSQYAEDNFGDNFKSAMDVMNMGANLLKRLAKEYEGTMALVKGSDDPGTASILQSFWNKVEAATKTFKDAAGKFVKDNNPAESAPDSKILGAETIAPGGFFNAFSYDSHKSRFLASKPEGFSSNRNLKQAVSGKPQSVVRNAATVKADAEEAARGLVRYKGMFANIMKVIIGIFLLIYTVINLIKYFGGSGGSQEGVGPLARVFVSLVVCLILLGVLDQIVAV